MADFALRPDSVRANPEPTSSDPNRHSRRTALSAIAGVPLAATFGTIALPAMAAPGGWRKTLELHKSAKTAAAVYERDYYHPARDAWQARVAAVPPIVLPYKDAAGFSHEMRSDDDWSVRRVNDVMNGRRNKPPEMIDLCRKFASELANRDAKVEGCRASFDPIYDESCRLDELAGEACDRVINYPVSTISELLEKVDFIEAQDIPNDETVYPAVTADIRRLAAGGR